MHARQIRRQTQMGHSPCCHVVMSIAFRPLKIRFAGSVCRAFSSGVGFALVRSLYTILLSSASHRLCWAVECDHPNGGLIVLFLFATWLYIVIIHYLCQTTSSSDTRILLTFLQIVALYYGDTAPWISWFVLKLFLASLATISYAYPF